MGADDRREDRNPGQFRRTGVPADSKHVTSERLPVENVPDEGRNKDRREDQPGNGMDEGRVAERLHAFRDTVKRLRAGYAEVDALPGLSAAALSCFTVTNVSKTLP